MMSVEASDFSKKQESSPSTTTSKPSSWSRLKDHPRIVRVSRAFGGKDRHSKVCTVRGLRDRRVRLSVPTAIQLYDLQERLGVNQPSKVVDWLLDAAKHEIDELPPLQIPQGKEGLNIMLGKSKNVISGETSHERDESWARNDHQEQRQFISQDSTYVSSNNFNPFNSFPRWDPSNLTLSHPPSSSHGSTTQNEDFQNYGLVVPSSSSSHQVLVYHHQPGISTTQPYFPSSTSQNMSASNMDIFQQKEPNFQSSEMSNSCLNSLALRPLHFSMTANLLPSQNKHNDFHSGQP